MSYKYYRIEPPLKLGDDELTLLRVWDGRDAHGNQHRCVEALGPLRVDDGGDGVTLEPFEPVSVHLFGEKLPDETHFFAIADGKNKPLFDVLLAGGLIEMAEGVFGNTAVHGKVPACRLTDKVVAHLIG